MLHQWRLLLKVYFEMFQRIVMNFDKMLRQLKMAQLREAYVQPPMIWCFGLARCRKNMSLMCDPEFLMLIQPVYCRILVSTDNLEHLQKSILRLLLLLQRDQLPSSFFFSAKCSEGSFNRKHILPLKFCHHFPLICLKQNTRLVSCPFWWWGTRFYKTNFIVLVNFIWDAINKCLQRINQF